MLNQEFNSDIQEQLAEQTPPTQAQLVDHLQKMIENHARMSGHNVLDTLRALVNDDLLGNPEAQKNLIQILEEKSKTLKYGTAISLLVAIEKEFGWLGAQKLTEGEGRIKPQEMANQILDMRSELSVNFREPPRPAALKVVVPEATNE
jgi:hypothetical protein